MTPPDHARQQSRSDHSDRYYLAILMFLVVLTVLLLLADLLVLAGR